MVAPAAPALKTAGGPRRPARPVRRGLLFLALAHHGGTLARPPCPVHRTMVRSIIEGGRNEPSPPTFIPHAPGLEHIRD